MRARVWLSPLVYLSNNLLSLIGVVIVTIAGVTWLALLPATIRAAAFHPYVGILIYLGLPALFVIGLLLIPIGIYFNRRSQVKKGIYPANFPPLDLHNPELRKVIAFVGVTTILNLLIAGQVSYAAVRYMDSVSFCGQTCHTVMKPEFTAYQGSPHARVECVNCHIGSGASWFVRSKLSGAGQVLAVMLNTYPRPIPVPVRNLRPARETCEACHWPQKFGEDRVKDILNYADDEQNTLSHTVLLLHIGGGPYGVGIHGMHLGEGTRVRYYATDEKRQTIPWVEYTSGGKSTVYTADKKAPDESRIRVMDCMDCHNRPTHTFELAERGVNRALTDGSISPALPFAKKKSVEVLKQSYSTSDDAAARIPAAFEAYYQQSYPDIYKQRQDEVRRSARGVLAVYQRNVFPEMKVTWGTYLNNIGHTDSDGCFRCHDGSHSSADNKSITQDCSACHNLLASDEKNPKILNDLGLVEPGKK
ncbi:MAG TPA: NapC/NirT family cytochrome c [Candidatus Angelobacter sp.]